MHQRLNFDIYPGRANAVKVTLVDNGTAINHMQLSRVILYVGSTPYDSDVTPTMFDMTNTGFVSVQLGEAETDIVPGRYPGKLVVFDDADYADGYVWPIDFTITVGAI